MLEVQDVSVVGDRGGLALKDVSLEVRAGEIVAVAGVAERSEPAEAAVPASATWSGAVRVRGHDLRPGDRGPAIAAGVAYVPEDRLGRVWRPA